MARSFIALNISAFVFEIWVTVRAAERIHNIYMQGLQLLDLKVPETHSVDDRRELHCPALCVNACPLTLAIVFSVPMMRCLARMLFAGHELSALAECDPTVTVSADAAALVDNAAVLFAALAFLFDAILAVVAAAALVDIA